MFKNEIDLIVEEMKDEEEKMIQDAILAIDLGIADYVEEV